MADGSTEWSFKAPTRLTEPRRKLEVCSDFFRYSDENPET